tara:strand:- start:225 stop:1001 length:777 start_codon:yes stop_codon:yes gene_type:complete
MTLITKDFSTGYQGNEVIKSISLSLKRSEWLGIIGANGSGKSTFLKGISRILDVYSGTAYLDGQDIHHSSTKEMAKKIAVLPQHQKSNLPLTVYELVCLGRSPHKKWWELDFDDNDHSKVERAIGLTDMTALKDKYVDTLSGGQRQRAFLSLALAQDAKTLLLDEPTTFLDLRYQLQFLDLLKKINQEQKISIVTVIHDLNLAARYCDRIAVLKDGELLAIDSPREVLNNTLMKKAFRVETCQIETPIGLQICTIKSE